MSTAANVLFWIGTAAVLITFGCAVANNFVKEKAKEVLTCVIAGASITAFICYIIYEIIK